MTVAAVLLAGALAFPQSATFGQDHHASPDGTPGGDGSRAKPWDLATALRHPAAVKPGDTIWLRGGTYRLRGKVESTLKGAAEAPIVVRQAPGERAVIDGGTDSGACFSVRGPHAWFWGFEFMSSSPRRSPKSSKTYESDRGGTIKAGASLHDGADALPGIKLINLVVHDTAGAFETWESAVGAEIYGCLVYYTGADAADRSHGHGLYAQNDKGTKRVVDNIFFGGYGDGIHAFGQKGRVNNFHVEGNILFNSGWNSSLGTSALNLQVHSGIAAERPALIENYSYFTPEAASGWAAVVSPRHSGARIEKNVFVSGQVAFSMLNAADTDVVAENTFVGRVEGVTPDKFPDNRYLEKKPARGQDVFLRPNRYEPGRAHLCVFNWDQADSARVDVSSVLMKGDRYEVRDAQNYFGRPAASGTFDGTPLVLPLTLTEVAPVIGAPARPFVHTPREFNAFILLRAPKGP